MTARVASVHTGTGTLLSAVMSVLSQVGTPTVNGASDTRLGARTEPDLLRLSEPAVVRRVGGRSYVAEHGSPRIRRSDR